MKPFLRNLVKVAPDFLISAILILLYAFDVYKDFTPTVQTIMLKTTLVSLGFLHAHITQALLFPAIDWRRDNADAIEKARAVLMYCTFVYCYAIGG